MEYWYLWVVFALLCVITAFVFRRASKAMRLHNDGQKKMYEEIERLKTLKEKFKSADADVIVSSDSRELLGGAYAVLQADLERAEIPDVRFAAMPLPCRYVYTLACFIEDAEENGLTFFFKNNGTSLLQYAAGALEAVGQLQLSSLVAAEYAMFDENNEETSLDATQFPKFDDDFRTVYDADTLLESIKRYIFTYRKEILYSAAEEL